MQLLIDIIILSEVGQRERHEYCMMASMWYLKYDTNETTYKAETDSEM